MPAAIEGLIIVEVVVEMVEPIAVVWMAESAARISGPCGRNKDPNGGTRGGLNNDRWSEACTNPRDCFSNS